MRRYVARRLLLLVPVLLGVSVVVFMVLHLSPGDPAEIMLGSQATQEDLARLRQELGLTEPLSRADAYDALAVALCHVHQTGAALPTSTAARRGGPASFFDRLKPAVVPAAKVLP